MNNMSVLLFKHSTSDRRTSDTTGLGCGAGWIMREMCTLRIRFSIGFGAARRDAPRDSAARA